MRVGLTGASGLVGSRLPDLLPHREFVALGRHDGIELTAPDPESWRKRLSAVDALVHAAAHTNVDGVEGERAMGRDGPAWTANVEATRLLARICGELGIPFLFISTDFVFPVTLEGPFPEAPTPATEGSEMSWYGWTKAAAELACAAETKPIILRISYPFRAAHPTRPDHARRILELEQKGTLYPLFDDQTFTPTFIDDAAKTADALLQHRRPGIYHCATSDRTTPFDFGRRLLESLGRPTEGLRAGPFRQAPGRAPRPRSGGLQTQRSREAGACIRGLSEILPDFAAQVRGRG